MVAVAVVVTAVAVAVMAVVVVDFVAAEGDTVVEGDTVAAL
jgi:hypothetical protein